MHVDSFQQEIIPTLNIVFDGSSIDQVRTLKLLGVTVDDNLKRNHHIDNTLKPISKNLNLVRRLSRFLPRKALVTFYFDYFTTVPLYGATVQLQMPTDSN